MLYFFLFQQIALFEITINSDTYHCITISLLVCEGCFLVSTNDKPGYLFNYFDSKGKKIKCKLEFVIPDVQHSKSPIILNWILLNCQNVHPPPIKNWREEVIFLLSKWGIFALVNSLRKKLWLMLSKSSSSTFISKFWFIKKWSFNYSPFQKISGIFYLLSSKRFLQI